MVRAPRRLVASTKRKQRMDNYLTLVEAAEISGYTPSHLRYLVRTGRLVGVKLGRDWFTTAEALERYKATDPHPGPKPKSEREGS